MPFPALVPESVIVTAVSVKINAEPVFVRRIPFFLLDIFKSPEASSYMVEYAVEHDFYIVFVERLADFPEIFVRSEAAVDFREIPCVISVIVGLEDRIQDN